jgi:hypothetical protein
VGYEINEAFVAIARDGLSAICTPRVMAGEESPPPGGQGIDSWQPRIPDMQPAAPRAPKTTPALSTVVEVRPDCTLILDTGTRVGFLGLHINDTEAALEYLKKRVLKKKVFLREEVPGEDSLVKARVVLKNRISINAQLVKAGVAEARGGERHGARDR